VEAHERLVKLATRNMLKRFVFQSADTEIIDGIRRDIDDALVMFNVRT